MKKFFGMALLPVILATTPVLALAAQPAGTGATGPETMTAKQHAQMTQTTQWNGTGKQWTGTPGQQTTAATTWSVSPQWAQGQWNLATRHWPEAASQFQALLGTEPNNVHALDGLATALFQQGRYDEATSNIERAISLDPVNGRLFWTKGQILEAQDKPVEALEAYLTFTSLAPDDAATLTALGRADMLWKATEPKWTEAKRQYLEGLRYLSLHQPEQAALRFERFKALEPNNAWAGLWLGRAYMEWGQPEKAIPQFEGALRLSADNPMAYYQLGRTYELRGETEQAKEAWQKFIRVAPQSEAALQINRRLDWRQQ